MGKEEALFKIGRETTIIILGFVLGTFFQYLYKAVLARSLGPESFGVFSQGLGLVYTAAIISLAGLQLSIPRFMSFYEGKNEQEKIGKIVFAGVFILLVTSIIVSIVFFLFSEYIALYIFDEPALVIPLKIFSVAVIPLACIEFVKALFQGQQDALRKVIIDDFIWSGAIIFFVTVAVVFGLGVEGVTIAYLLATLVGMVAGTFLYWKKSNHGLEFNKLPVRKLATFGWPLFIISLFLVLNRWFDVLMLGWLGESSQAGIYSIAFSLAGYVVLLSNSLSFIFMPVVSELYGEQDLNGIREVFSVSTRWLITLTLPILAGVLIFPEEVIRVLFGSQYVSGKVPLMILSLGFFYKIIRGPSDLVLLSLGKNKRLMLGSGTVAFLIVALNLVLIPKYGITGAAVSTFIAYIVGETVILLFAADELGGFPYNKSYLRVLPPIILSSSIIYWLKHLIAPDLVLSILLGVILVLIYLISLYLFEGLNKEDYHTAKRLYRRR